MPGCRRTCGQPRQVRSRILAGMAARLASDLPDPRRRGAWPRRDRGRADRRRSRHGRSRCAEPGRRSAASTTDGPRRDPETSSCRDHLPAIAESSSWRPRRAGTKSISIESPRDVDRDRSERESTQSRRHACCKQIPTSSIALRSDGSSRDRRIRSAMFARTATNKSNNQKTEMLQRARAALPLTKIRERAFEGAFFSVALIAMAGWVYFITLLLVRLFLWFFN